MANKDNLLQYLCVLILLSCMTIITVIADTEVEDNSPEHVISKRQACRPCDVDGEHYSSPGSFSYDRGCFRYMCTCACNGAYSCPTTQTQRVPNCRSNNMSYGSRTSTRTRPSDTDSRTITRTRTSSRGSRIRPLIRPANDRRTGTHISTSNRGSITRPLIRPTNDRRTGTHISTSNRGSITRPRIRPTNDRRTRTRTRTSDRGSSGVETRRQTGPSNIRVTGTGSRMSIRRRQRPSNIRQINTRPRNMGLSSYRCQTCNANGKIVAGGSSFQMQDRCWAYDSCLCKCDSTWTCVMSRKIC